MNEKDLKQLLLLQNKFKILQSYKSLQKTVNNLGYEKKKK
jgi:hypothetical protein